MKDIIKRVVISFVSWGFLWYLLFLFVNNATIVQWAYSEYNILYYIILTVICLYLFILFGIYPVHVKMTKATLFVCWLALVVIWDTVLTNNPSNSIYVGDLFKLLWVVLTLLAWTNLLITDKVTKQSADSKIEIIEV